MDITKICPLVKEPCISENCIAWKTFSCCYKDNTKDYGACRIFEPDKYAYMEEAEHELSVLPEA